MSSTALQARRERVRLIRRRVIGAGTALFLATTGGILVQLASGHDPALARSHTTTTAATSSSGSSVSAGSSPSSGQSSDAGSSSVSGQSSDSGSSSSSGSDSGSSPTPMTTSQS